MYLFCFLKLDLQVSLKLLLELFCTSNMNKKAIYYQDFKRNTSYCFLIFYLRIVWIKSFSAPIIWYIMQCYKNAYIIKSSHIVINEIPPHFCWFSTGNKFVGRENIKENNLQRIKLKNIISINCQQFRIYLDYESYFFLCYLLSSYSKKVYALKVAALAFLCALLLYSAEGWIDQISVNNSQISDRI